MGKVIKSGLGGPMRAVTYSRISMDREGLERGTSRQKADNRELAEEIGATIVAEFVDDDTGASTRSKKKREQYAAMLDLVRNGGADVIVAYSNSRLTRRPVEFEDLIQLHEQTGVRIITKVSGNDDLSTADGRMIARIKASVDAGEAERTGERVSRAHRQTALEGRPIGHRMFGWEEDRVTIRKSEAEPMLEVVQLLLDGLPTLRAAKHLNEQGVFTAKGKEWTATTLKQYLLNPRLYGVRMYQREPMVDQTGNPIMGTWEPLFDEATHEALKAKIKRPDHRGGVVSHPGSRNYMLTGLLVCGVCRGTMYGGRQANGYGYYYSCRNQRGEKHANYISGESAERVIRRLVVEQIEADALQPSEHGTFDGEARLRELDDAIDATMAQIGGPIPAQMLYNKVNELSAEKSELEAKRKVFLAASAKPAPTRTTPEEVAAQDHYAQRGLIDRYLAAVIVKPPANSSPGRKFDASRLVPIPRESEQPLAAHEEG